VFDWGFRIYLSHRSLQWAKLDLPRRAASLVQEVTERLPAAAMVADKLRSYLELELFVLEQIDRLGDERGAYICMAWSAPAVFVPTSV
jgi:hypothetical protein